MKLTHINFLHRICPNTLRVAASYLAIIMAFSVGFSFAFYQTSTRGLRTQFNATGVSNQPLVVGDGGQPKQPAVGTIQTNSGRHSASAATVSDLNAQLQKYMNDVRSGLQYRLILLNVLTLLFGSVASWYLARKTLRPIEAASEAQARFSSDASHELRTPLAALRVRSEVALRNPHLTLAQAKKVIAESMRQTVKLEELSNALLQLGHENHRGLPQAGVSLGEVANDAMNHVVERAQSKHIAIAETVPRISVLAHAQSLTQAVVILLDNAIKYSGERSAIHLEGDTEGKWGRLVVRDHGPGIAPQDLPHIFERFYRADHSRSKHGAQGYGLGLSIAHKIVRQNHGKITVRSVPGEGAVFTIWLPLA